MQSPGIHCCLSMRLCVTVATVENVNPAQCPLIDESSLRHAGLRYGAYLSWWSFYQVIFRAIELKDVLVSPQETLTDESDESENVHTLKVKVWTSFVFQEAELNLKAILLFGASSATL